MHTFLTFVVVLAGIYFVLWVLAQFVGLCIMIATAKRVKAFPQRNTFTTSRIQPSAVLAGAEFRRHPVRY